MARKLLIFLATICTQSNAMEKLGNCVVCGQLHYLFESGRCVLHEYRALRDFALAHPDDENAWRDLDALNQYIEESIG